MTGSCPACGVQRLVVTEPCLCGLLPPPFVEGSDQDCIAKAFSASPILFDEIIGVVRDGTRWNYGGHWFIFSSTAGKNRLWAAEPVGSGFEFTAVENDAPLLEPVSDPLIAEAPSLAQMMGAEIIAALGEFPTPESCETALALTKAAQDFLFAMRFRRPYWLGPSPYENLERLAKTQGVIRENEDEAP